MLADVLPECHSVISAWRTGHTWSGTKRNAYGRLEPVTAADHQVQRLLVERLHIAWPDLPAIGEEDATIPQPLPDDCLLVDPIDGTLSLIDGSPDFAVAVCLVRGGRPVQALIDLPAYDVRVAATTNRVLVQGDPTRLPRYGPDVVLVSPRQQAHAARLLNLHAPTARPVPIATASIKMTLVALGHASAAVYLSERPGGSAPWDYAAAALAVGTAGGIVRDQAGRDLVATLPAFTTGWHATNSTCVIPNLHLLTREEP